MRSTFSYTAALDQWASFLVPQRLRHRAEQSRRYILVVGFFPRVLGALVPHRDIVESELLRRNLCGDYDTRWVVGCLGLVGVGSSFFSCNVHRLSRSRQIADTSGRLYGMGRHGFWDRLRRGLHWWLLIVKSKLLAGGVMTTKVVFLLGSGCGHRVDRIRCSFRNKGSDECLVDLYRSSHPLVAPCSFST